jgi:hypothetical protein
MPKPKKAHPTIKMQNRKKFYRSSMHIFPFTQRSDLSNNVLGIGKYKLHLCSSLLGTNQTSSVTFEKIQTYVTPIEHKTELRFQ